MSYPHSSSSSSSSRRLRNRRLTGTKPQSTTRTGHSTVEYRSGGVYGYGGYYRLPTSQSSSGSSGTTYGYRPRQTTTTTRQVWVPKQTQPRPTTGTRQVWVPKQPQPRPSTGTRQVWVPKAKQPTPPGRTTDTPASAGPPAAPPPPPVMPGGPPPPPPGAGGAAKKASAGANPNDVIAELKTKQSKPQVVDPRRLMGQRVGELTQLLDWHAKLLVKVGNAQEIQKIDEILLKANKVLGVPKQVPDGALVAEVTDALNIMRAIGIRPLPEIDGKDLEAMVVEAASTPAKKASSASDDNMPAGPSMSPAEQVESMLAFIPKNEEVKANAEWIEQLRAQGLYNAAAYVIEHTSIVGARLRAAEVAAAEDKKAREEALLKPELVPTAVKDLGDGHFDTTRSAVKELLSDTLLTAAQTHPMLKRLVTDAFAGGAARATAAPDVCADLILGALKLAKIPTERQAEGAEFTYADVATLLATLDAPAAQAVATNLLSRHWRSQNVFDDASVNWLIASIDKGGAWNDPEKGLAARAYNMLWHAGRYEDMMRLIDLNVSTHLPASDGADSGRNREGVWSGWVQPLEHLLGNYVRLTDRDIMAAELAKMPEDTPQQREKKAAETKKLIGAAKLLEKISKRTDTTILTTWKEVVNSQLIRGFPDAPGTIWGFEDVRLPYVQAAHDTMEGQQPLRMIELWDAVERTLNTKGYPALLANPEKVIKECIDVGVAKLKAGLKEKPREYYGRDTPKFEENFRQQVQEYLQFLAKQTPKAKVATAELSGKRVDKWMGALGCKAGLWWAAEKGVEPVYYVLDGLNENDAINYKEWKSKKINARMGDPLHVQAFGEVITLSEIREILGHWNDEDRKLRDVIKFVEKGEILEGDKLKKIDDWAARMKVQDDATKSATSRTSPSWTALEPKLRGLDNGTLKALDTHEVKQIVLQADLVKMAADAHYELLSGALANCKVLWDNHLLPEDLPAAYKAMIDLPLGERRAAAEKLKADYLTEGQVAPALLVPLRNAVDKWADAKIV